MKYFIIVLLILQLLKGYSQEKRIVEIDLRTGIIDTLQLILFDTTKQSDNTNFNIGNYSELFSNLELNLPDTADCEENTRFTNKQNIDEFYDVSTFPIRTSIKLFDYVEGELKNKCSGSMISSKHVLTACHCVADSESDSIKSDSLLVCPVYNNGNQSEVFPSCWVSKVYKFENFRYSWVDFAILELEEPIGLETGWIGIGFEKSDLILNDDIYYKFSYPATTILSLDTNEYNGDTLYFNYGVIDYFDDKYIGVQNYRSGIPGESGSSIISAANYISYGVLCWTPDLRHRRIEDWIFYNLKSVIENDIGNKISDVSNEEVLTVYPNPAIDKLNYLINSTESNYTFKLYDINGKLKIGSKYITKKNGSVDISFLPSGMYVAIFHSKEKTISKMIFKNGH